MSNAWIRASQVIYLNTVDDFIICDEKAKFLIMCLLQFYSYAEIKLCYCICCIFRNVYDNHGLEQRETYHFNGNIFNRLLKICVFSVHCLKSPNCRFQLIVLCIFAVTKCFSTFCNWFRSQGIFSVYSSGVLWRKEFLTAGVKFCCFINCRG